MRELLSPSRAAQRKALGSVVAKATLALAIAGCGAGSPSVPPVRTLPLFVGECEILVPRTLPSGATPGGMVVAGEARFAWGQGPDQVVEAVGTFALGRPETFDVPVDSKQRVEVRGEAALVIPIGDDGVGQVALTWQSGECPYTVWLAPGQTLDQAIRYAAGF